MDAAQAVRSSDLEGLGRLMSASHASLRDLHEVSTPTLDAVAAAAGTMPGCLGARMVGAGFGGTVVALTRRGSAAACGQAMSDACGGGSTFELRPSPGLRCSPLTPSRAKLDGAWVAMSPLRRAAPPAI